MPRLRYALVFVSLLYLSSSTPGLAQKGDRVFDQTYAFSPGDMLSIATSSSDIILRAGGNEARVEVYGRGREVAEGFRRLNFSVERDGGVLIIKTERDNDGWFQSNRAQFDIVVTAPERLDLNIATSSGDIAFRRVEGTGEIATSSGDVEFDTHVGDLSVASSSGDVEANRVEGTFSFSTSSGDLSVDEVTGSSVTFASSSGDLDVDTIDTKHFEARTSSGDISIDMLSGDAEIGTSSGDVDLDEIVGALSVSTSSGGVQADLGTSARVEISTGSGEVSLHAPSSLAADVDIHGGAVRLNGFALEGTVARRSIEGRIGGGGELLKVSTGSGRVSLSAR